MKVTATCPTCLDEQQKAGKEPRMVMVAGELDDNGSVHVECDHAHKTIVIYDSRRYQVLVQSAARAFLDGYTNEVVAVMSSALERAYEFYIRVSCRAKGIAAEVIEDAWKVVAAQSERQYGAFQFLYLTDQGKPYQLDTRITEFRNRVIHRGKIVREHEALEFAEKVFKAIRELECILEAKFSALASEESERELKAQESKIPAGVNHMRLHAFTVTVDTASNQATGTAGKFIEHVAAIDQSRKQGIPP
jgi:hypothetical protein